MGACIRIAGPPQPISIMLPGGITLQSQTNSTQSIPNGMDPVQSLFQQAAPVLGAMKPAFDIVGFAMAIISFLLTLLGMLAGILLLLGNPALAQIFPPPTIVNTDDDTPIPGFASGVDTGVPDASKLIVDAMAVFLKGLKLVSLIPQLSMLGTVKDSMNGAMVVMSGVTAKINSLNDAMARIPADTGDPVIDKELACAREALVDALAHAAGPLSNLVPTLQVVSTLAEPISQGLPGGVTNLIEFAVNMNLITFENDAAKADFMTMIETLKTGTLLEFPDLTNISDLPAAMDDIRNKLSPVLGPLESVQSLLVKLQNC